MNNFIINGVINYDKWVEYRSYLLNDVYPCEIGKWRFDVEFARLNDIEIVGQTERYKTYYQCADWSSIFGIYGPYESSVDSEIRSYASTITNNNVQYLSSIDKMARYRMIIENGHKDPVYGKRVVVASSFSSLSPEPWGMNKPNIRIYIDNIIYCATWFEFLHSWSGDYASRYPLSECPIRKPIWQAVDWLFIENFNTKNFNTRIIPDGVVINDGTSFYVVRYRESYNNRTGNLQVELSCTNGIRRGISSKVIDLGDPNCIAHIRQYISNSSCSTL